MGIFSILAFVIFVLGGFFFPLASPPGEEDQRMLMLAPEECFLYSSWPAVAKINPDANPTEKWLAQPKAGNFAVKVRLLLVKSLMMYKPWQPRRRIDKAFVETIDETLSLLAEASCAEPTAIVISTVDFDPNLGTKLEGIAVVRLGDQKEAFQACFGRWCQAIEDSVDPNELNGDMQGENVSFSISKIDNIEVIRADFKKNGLGIRNETSFICQIDDLAIVASSEHEIKATIANMKTPAPQWLTQLRKELTVDRVSCTSYLNWTSAVSSLNDDVLRDSWLGISWRSILLEGKAIGTVVGLDPELGCVSQTKFWADPESKKGVLNLLGKQPLELDDLKGISKAGVVCFAGKLNPDGVIELIGDLMKESRTSAVLESTMKELEEFTGVNIEQQVIQSVGDLVRFQIGISQSWKIPWRADIEIEEEMTFPDVFRQINERMKKTIEASFGGEVTTQRVGTTKFFVFKSPNGNIDLAWGLDDKRLLIGDGSQVDLMAEKIPLPEARQLAGDTSIIAMFETGKAKGWGKPIAILRLDIDPVLKKYASSIDLFQDSDEEISPASDFRWSDFPTAEVLREGISPTTIAVFRVKDGYVMRREQNHPNSPGIAIIGLAFMGAIAGMN